MASLSQAAKPAGALPASSLWREIWRHRLEYLFICPFFIQFAVFSLYPLGWALLLSFQRWSGFGDATWVGLDNYRAMIQEDVFTQALVNTLEFTAVLVPTGIMIALFFAVLLNISNLRGRGTFRTIYFLPFITSSVIVGIVFKMLLDDTFGWVNGIIKLVGFDPISWLRTPIWAKVSVIMLTHWQGMGVNILIMLGGLQAIQREIYEAAEIDGANPWQKFWRVTLPLMRPVVLFVTIIGTIGVLNMFNQPFILTNGGPENSTTTLTFRLYQLAFRTIRFGDAAALGFIIGVLVLLISMVQLYVGRDRE